MSDSLDDGENAMNMKTAIRFHHIITMGLILLLVTYPDISKAHGAATPSPPSSPVKLIFIHHSTGENWLADDNGGLGAALMRNNYFVSDTNYGWGPDSIGDRTDIGNWYEWFRSGASPTYLAALYNENGQNADYSRLEADPGGENTIIMFKSCFPNSNLGGSPDDQPASGENPLRGEDAWSDHMTVGNARGIYMDLLNYFATRRDKLFVAITAPPLSPSETSSTRAANARAFNNWLANEWLKDYPYKNVALFDFYNVLTSNGGNSGVNDAGSPTGNHHRWRNGAPEHTQTVSSDTSAYPSSSDDSHPTQAGNLKATEEFLPMLNWFYSQWKDSVSGSCPTNAPETEITANGKDSALSVHTNENVSISVSFSPGCMSGKAGDLWILASTPFGWFFYDMQVKMFWDSGIKVSSQSPFTEDLNKTILETTLLPEGKYTFYLGFDTVPNNAVDLESLTYDSIEVEVTP